MKKPFVAADGRKRALPSADQPVSSPRRLRIFAALILSLALALIIAALCERGEAPPPPEWDASHSSSMSGIGNN